MPYHLSCRPAFSLGVFVLSCLLFHSKAVQGQTRTENLRERIMAEHFRGRNPPNQASPPNGNRQPVYRSTTPYSRHRYSGRRRYRPYYNDPYFYPRSPYYDYYSRFPTGDPSFEAQFGPAAVTRKLGLANRREKGAGVQRGGAPPNFAHPVEPPKGQIENRRSNNSARRYVDFGDRYFRDQRYHTALLRYKKASKQSPDLAAAYFRQAWALVGLSKYDAAGRAIRKGLELQPDWPASGFRLAKLYGDNNGQKQAHIDALAARVQERPNDSEALFVMATFLHFDGQGDQSREVFDQAAQISGRNAPHLAAFMKDADDG